MNCKPGDLAIFLPPPYTFGSEHAGRILRVVQPSIYPEAWIIDPLFPNGDDSTWDKYLRPIRPGESTEESTEVMKRLHDTRKEQTA